MKYIALILAAHLIAGPAFSKCAVQSKDFFIEMQNSENLAWAYFGVGEFGLMVSSNHLLCIEMLEGKLEIDTDIGEDIGAALDGLIPRNSEPFDEYEIEYNREVEELPGGIRLDSLIYSDEYYKGVIGVYSFRGKDTIQIVCTDQYDDEDNHSIIEESLNVLRGFRDESSLDLCPQ